MTLRRRHFFLATAALPLVAQTKLRTAVIGTGNRGSYLLEGVLQQPESSVAALCDIKPDRLDKAATSASRDNPRTTSDWRQVIDNPAVDAVFIATPPHLHAEMAVAALKNGKHVYCEKPIGITPAQVQSVVNAARASSKVFTAGQQLRSVQRFAQTVRRIQDGLLGDLVMVKAQRHANTDLPHDGTSGDWYFDVTKSGGYLIEQSVHNLDLCNWAVSAHPTLAMGLGAANFYRNQPAGRTIFDSGSITYQYPKELNMSFTQNVFHPRGLPGGGQAVLVYGTKGAMDLFAPVPTLYPVDPSAQPAAVWEKSAQPENPHAHIASFYAAILSGGPNPADIVIGAEAALTAILGHLAMSTQKPVTWQSLNVKL